MHPKNFLTAAVLTVALSACGNNTDNTSDNTSDNANSASTAAPTMAVTEAADESNSAALCLDAGPQTPRDIASVTGTNSVTFTKAPPASEMNLCNIHTHTNAEHKAPGFSVFVNASDSGGYACNETTELTPQELLDPGKSDFNGVKPGDTIEVHWVHSSCDVAPGEGLGACLSEDCTDPILRVEAQAFLVVNDTEALDFTEFGYSGQATDGLHQAKALPTNTGTPVTFLGSTTGPSYTQSECSPAKVTWNVRPNCARVDVNSLHRWAAQGNVFKETKSHGVRQLVTAPELLAPIN